MAFDYLGFMNENQKALGVLGWLFGVFVKFSSQDLKGHLYMVLTCDQKAAILKGVNGWFFHEKIHVIASSQSTGIKVRWTWEGMTEWE